MNAGRAFCCALLLAGMPARSAGGSAARAAVRAIALAPDGERLAGVDAAGRILLWRLADGAVSVPGPARDAVLTAVAFAGDGRRLAVSGAAGDGDGAAFVELWDLQTGRRSWRRPAAAAGCCGPRSRPTAGYACGAYQRPALATGSGLSSDG